jgi:hypothetical protein
MAKIQFIFKILGKFVKTIIMKLFSAVFIFLLFCNSCQKHNHVIDQSNPLNNKVGNYSYDILEIIGNKPVHAEMKSCSFHDNSQVTFSAVYTLKGIHAGETETFLIRQFGMAPMFFVCCGWETKNKPGYLRSVHYDNDNTLLEINMYSQETLIQERSRWNEIDTFYISTRIIEI